MRGCYLLFALFAMYVEVTKTPATAVGGRNYSRAELLDLRRRYAVLKSTKENLVDHGIWHARGCRAGRRKGKEIPVIISDRREPRETYTTKARQRYLQPIRKERQPLVGVSTPNNNKLHPMPNILVINARSLRNKLDECQTLLLSMDIHVAIITETWFNSNISDAQFDIEGYHLFSKPRQGRRGGGVAIYVNNKIQAKTIDIVIPEDLEYFISLEILRLDGNNISEMNSTVFKSLSNLRELYLNHSGVRYLSADIFLNLESLQKLHLENNKLQSLPENIFAGLKRLTLLGIHGNPLTCGCDVVWFTNWLKSRVYLLSQGRNVSCVASTEVTREILTLSAAQFDCYDQQAAQARNQFIVSVSIPLLVLVIIILVCAIVIVKRKEAIQVYLYARYGWRFREEEEDEDKEYDAFLSYSQHDLDVVLQDVLPALENREPPFRVCLHHRDFLPGVPIAENILNAVSASKRTIILLSNNFLESDWCQLEFQAAHAQMLQDRANRVIVILLDDVPAENAPADIQHYLKTNTYLKWGDERFWERLIYAMPRPRPHAHAQNMDGDQLALVELDNNR
ncbi:uncharacterized protein LOC144920757 [Branchiostoma floridae x Branchiostoma belcheri]